MLDIQSEAIWLCNDWTLLPSGSYSVSVQNDLVVEAWFLS